MSVFDLVVTKSLVICTVSINCNSRGASNDERKCLEIYGVGLYQDDILMLPLVV